MRTKKWKIRARVLKHEVHALYLCSRHPDTPWYAKLCALLIVAYALSLIDLIPDFTPIIGYVDDLVLIPAGIALLIRMMPQNVLEECRIKAQSAPSNRQKARKGAVTICFHTGSAFARPSSLSGA
jgi:uncharacterized membrane protein YkvA (DUF1232 family)